MSKIPDEFPKSVFFLFSDENTEPLGTGFIVERAASAIFRQHYYAVSNFHVVKDGPKASIIRLNNADSTSRFLKYSSDDWIHVPSGDDLVAIDITDEFDQTNRNVAAIHESYFLKPFDVEARGINPGENAFMIGLLVDHGGKSRNIPAARFGNLTQLATSENPILQPTGFASASHLVDMRSRTGFSGSPVFAYRTQMDHLDRVLRGHEGSHFSSNSSSDAFVSLLGVHCGQLNEPLLATDRQSNRYTFSLPSSVTIVVPAWRISELLDRPEFQYLRDQRERQWDADPNQLFR